MIVRHRLGRYVAPVLGALLVLLTACTSDPDAETTPSTASSPERPDGVSINPPPVTAAAGCQETVPVPVARRYPWRASLFGWHSSHGNGWLWVGGLGPNGVIAVGRHSAFVDRHGGVSWKLGWWREVPGGLVITGRRLDGAGQLGSDAGTVDEYGPTGFVASSLRFSSQGCWRVTGRVEGTALTFVTRVVIRP
jgi:hypothetical protein